jgi:hypothetical protein
MTRAGFFDSDRKTWRAVPRLLTDESQHEEIAHCGHGRARRNNYYSGPMLAAVIERLVPAFEKRR